MGGSDEFAGRLVHVIQRSDPDPLVLATAVGGVHVGYPDERLPLDDDALRASAASARALAGEPGDESTIVLGCALALLTAAKAPGTVAPDVLFAAGRA